MGPVCLSYVIAPIVYPDQLSESTLQSSTPQISPLGYDYGAPTKYQVFWGAPGKQQ